MGFSSTAFLNHATVLLFYTLLVFKIPHSSSLRIRIAPASLSFISTHNHLKYLQNGSLHKNTANSPFGLRSARVDDIVDSIKALTLLEIPELVKKMEEVFGVTPQKFTAGPLAERPSEVRPEEPFKDEVEDEEVDLKSLQMSRKRIHTVVINKVEQEARKTAFALLREFYPGRPILEIRNLLSRLPLELKTFSNKKEAKDLADKFSVQGIDVQIV